MPSIHKSKHVQLTLIHPRDRKQDPAGSKLALSPAENVLPMWLRRSLTSSNNTAISQIAQIGAHEGLDAVLKISKRGGRGSTSVMAAGRGPARTGNGASPLAAVDRRRSRARCGFGVRGVSCLKSRAEFRVSASEFSFLALL